MCQAGHNMGEGGSITKTREVKITHMCGLNDLAVWESDVKWVFCMAFIVYGHIGQEEVGSGTGVSDGFSSTKCNIDGVGCGRSGACGA